jgi:hypothetical protein
MHPDNIARLAIAPTRQQDNTHDQINNEIEIVDGQQDQTDNNEEIEIVFEPDEEATNEELSEEEDEPDHPEFDRLIQTRSGQVSRPVHKYVMSKGLHNWVPLSLRCVSSLINKGSFPYRFSLTITSNFPVVQSVSQVLFLKLVYVV